ncbi:hypothetical protein PILCRDRAFT_581948 [Piloderma croceum F 1598]|uniref:F-box domain-containing protein n=1 Tax=Piloderma croceum (strain F 1598) TaxID=765440 RepID=A0A0C3F1P7_PILCF|nr:hypothetical protein PILCRDRAFT_581948 [Piloderma croceum F 1598]
MGQLSAVKELAISNSTWDDLTPEAEESLFSVFNNIEQLDISIWKFDSPRRVFQIIASYPCLERLSVQACSPRKTLGTLEFQTTDNRVPASLQTLQCSSFNNGDFLNWVLYSQPIPALATIDFGVVQGCDAYLLGKVIKALGPKLNHLRISFVSYIAPGSLVICLA